MLTRRSRPNGDCLEWQGCRDHQGYGRLKFWGKHTRAHRVAWALAHGEWPQLCVCHKCDNPSCVNAEHLFLGTRLDNMRDMIAKGRARHPSRPGELSPSARLTTPDVLAIRARWRCGKRGQWSPNSHSALAKEYGVSRSTIAMILCGRNWKHLLPASPAKDAA